MDVGYHFPLTQRFCGEVWSSSLCAAYFLPSLETLDVFIFLTSKVIKIEVSISLLVFLDPSSI